MAQIIGLENVFRSWCSVAGVRKNRDRIIPPPTSVRFDGEYAVGEAARLSKQTRCIVSCTKTKIAGQDEPGSSDRAVVATGKPF